MPQAAVARERIVAVQTRKTCSQNWKMSSLQRAASRATGSQSHQSDALTASNAPAASAIFADQSARSIPGLPCSAYSRGRSRSCRLFLKGTAPPP